MKILTSYQNGWPKAKQLLYKGLKTFAAILIFTTIYNTANATTATWNGGTSNSWSDGTNWTNGAGTAGIPDNTQDVDIASATNQPIMDISGGASIINLLVEDGMTLTLDGTNSLTITGNCTLGTSTTGILTTNGSALNIAGMLSGTGSSPASGTLNIAANSSNSITISGNIYLKTILQGSGTSHVILNGNNQHIDKYTFNTLEITGTTIMDDDLRVNLNLIGIGTLDAGSHVLKLLKDMSISYFTASTSLVELLGTGTQTIGSSCGGYTFTDMGLYNSNTSLANDLTITDNIDFGASGVFILNNYNITIAPGANGTGPNAVGVGRSISQNSNTINNNYAGGAGFFVSNQGNNGGTLIKTVTTTPTIFPMGASSASYSPLTLTANTGTSVVNVSVSDSLLDGGSPQTNLTTSGNDYAVIKTWKAHNTTNVPHMTINITWHAHVPNSGDEDANFDESNTYVAYRTNQNGGTNWNPLGPTSGSTSSSSAADCWNITDQAASHLNMTACMDCFIATGSNGSTALPVTLVSFDAKYAFKKVTTNWTTASEVNNAGFIVQRSKDGISWAKVDSISGNGNSSVFHQYESVDNLSGITNPGILYYRLQQYDYNGMTHYSYIQTVNITEQLSPLEIFPNPASDIVNVKWNSDQDQPTKLQLTNLTGTVLFEENVQGGGYVLKQIDLSAYPSGNYLLKMIQGQKITTQVIKKISL